MLLHLLKEIPSAVHDKLVLVTMPVSVLQRSSAKCGAVILHAALTVNVFSYLYGFSCPIYPVWVVVPGALAPASIALESSNAHKLLRHVKVNFLLQIFCIHPSIPIYIYSGAFNLHTHMQF